MQTTQLDLTADTIDVRDIIARVEELDPEYSDIKLTDDEAEELAELRAILNELKGYGGDEQWRGDWYPVTLVRDSYFCIYAEQLARDCGYTDQAAEEATKNPLLAYIDWEAWARDVRMDYASVEIDDITYWYR